MAKVFDERCFRVERGFPGDCKVTVFFLKKESVRKRARIGIFLLKRKRVGVVSAPPRR